MYEKRAKTGYFSFADKHTTFITKHKRNYNRFIMNCKEKRIGHFFDYIAETCLELIEHIFFSIRKRRKWTSNLTEEYHIDKKYKEEHFVCDFLKERKKAITHNGYRIAVEYTTGNCKKHSIGTVVLRRKNKIISTAELITKEDDSTKLIYWVLDDK